MIFINYKYFICALLLLILSKWIWHPTELISSSIFCINDQVANKMCKLKNIIYNPSSSSFEVFVTSDSVINGVSSYKDLQDIQLSSVRSHVNFFANISLRLHKTDFSECTVYNKVFAFARFKPDNLMHIIHDDLIPLFLTLQRICEGNWNYCLKQFNLMFLDNNFDSPYSYLYQTFSKNNFIYSKNVTKKLCIKELYLGLDLSSVWYQYGFNQPRGITNNTSINSHILYKFKQFILSQNKISVNISNDVILFKRKTTRKLLNIDFVLQSIKHSFRDFNYKIVDVELNNSRQLLNLITNAKMVVGIHGAELILSIFMPNNSTVLELFPYGIPSNVVSFLKPLADLKILNYYQWTNNNYNLTIRHPEYPRALGGLKDLSEHQKFQISKVRMIKEIFCCTDDVFLHFMYQDTIVDSSFDEIVQKIKFDIINEYSVHYWMFPGKVQIYCKKHNGAFQIYWEPAQGIDSSLLSYSLYVLADNKHIEVATNDTNWYIETSAKNISVWISSIFNINNHSSVDMFLRC